MDIKQVRLNNLRTAITLAGGARKLADKADTNPAYLSQILSDTHPASIGHNLARKLEAAISKENGWMDTSHLCIGDRIKQLRKENNMTQRIIAKKMGTTEVAISNWETGKNELRGENLLKIAEILGVSSTWLQTGNGKQHRKGDSSINNLPEDVKEVIALFQQLTPKQQQRYTEALQETVKLNQYKKLP